MKRSFKLHKKSAHDPDKPISPSQKTSPPLNANAQPPNPVIQLQGIIGNQAVQRLLASAKSPVLVQQHAAPAVQRKPYGLESTGSIGHYTDHAVKLWTTNKQISLRDFTFSMMNMIAGELDSHGVPIPGWTLDTGLGTDGEFKQDSWKMLINPSKFSDKSVQNLGDLSKDELTSVVGTFYHEARHADQDFLVARMLAGKGDTAAQIHAKTKIPTEIAQEAVDKKLTKTSADKDQIPNAEILFDTMYGEHKELVEFVVNLAGTIQSLAEAAAKAADKNALHDVDVKGSDLVTELEKWSTTFQKKLDALGKKQKKTALDQQMFDDVTKIDKQVKIVIKEWKAIPKPIPKEDSEDFGQTLVAFLKELDPVYRRLENEKDAFSVEKTVKDKLKPKL